MVHGLSCGSRLQGRTALDLCLENNMEQCEAAQLLFGLGKGSGTPKHSGELGTGRAVGSGLDWADGQLVHVIGENEIPLRQSVLIGEVATATGLSRDHAGILLKHLSWDVNDTVAAWRERSRQLCEEVGFMAMLEPPAPAKIDATFLCKVCYCEEPESRAWQEACGHKYCLDCAEGYLKQAVEDGNGCLEKRCIEMGCQERILWSSFESILSGKERAMFGQIRSRSLVEDNPDMKWCPSPGCRFAIHYDQESNEAMDITCRWFFPLAFSIYAIIMIIALHTS